MGHLLFVCSFLLFDARHGASAQCVCFQLCGHSIEEATCHVQAINQHGVARMCRLLAVLQPALSSLGATGGAFRPESARAFEKARAYYSLLTLPADAVLKAALDRPTRFTSAEYLALLQVSIRTDLCMICNAGLQFLPSLESGPFPHLE
jgi:hypothetical protein